MKKLLSLLSVLTISGTAIPTTIAASPYQKEEIKLENGEINFLQEINLKHVKRNKRENNNFCNVTDKLKKIIIDDLNWKMRNTYDGPGAIKKVHSIANLNIKINSVNESQLIETIRKERVIKDSNFSILKNKTSAEQKQTSLGTDLKTAITESSTIGYTGELSGEIEIPSLPLLDKKGKVGFKFSRNNSTTNINTKEITKKSPNQTVTLAPNTQVDVISKLYNTEVIYKYLLSFEIDRSSDFTVQYMWKGIYDPNWWSFSDSETFNLYEFLDNRRKSIDNIYPTTIYDSNFACIEFKNNKIYFKHFPMEITINETELESSIENYKSI